MKLDIERREKERKLQKERDEMKKKSMENVVVDDTQGLRPPKTSNVVGSGGKPMGRVVEPPSKVPA